MNNLPRLGKRETGHKETSPSIATETNQPILGHSQGIDSISLSIQNNNLKQLSNPYNGIQAYPEAEISRHAVVACEYLPVDVTPFRQASMANPGSLCKLAGITTILENSTSSVLP